MIRVHSPDLRVRHDAGDCELEGLEREALFAPIGSHFAAMERKRNGIVFLAVSILKRSG